MKIYSALLEGITAFEGNDRDIKHQMKSKNCAEYVDIVNGIFENVTGHSKGI